MRSVASFVLALVAVAPIVFSQTPGRAELLAEPAGMRGVMRIADVGAPVLTQAKISAPVVRVDRVTRSDTESVLTAAEHYAQNPQLAGVGQRVQDGQCPGIVTVRTYVRVEDHRRTTGLCSVQHVQLQYQDRHRTFAAAIWQFRPGTVCAPKHRSRQG